VILADHRISIVPFVVLGVGSKLDALSASMMNPKSLALVAVVPLSVGNIFL
jgi:hypothetical protein